MGAKTGIEWTADPDGSPGATWNVLRGCELEDEGCANCYAMGQAHRQSGPGGAYEGLTKARSKGKGPIWTGVVRFVQEALDDPLSWRKGRTVFVNSMSDMFHRSVTREQIAAMVGVMMLTPRHRYIVLTKRGERARDVLNDLTPHECVAAILALGSERLKALLTERWEKDMTWPLPNLALGVSVSGHPNKATRRKEAGRLDALLATRVALRMVSVEPLLGHVDLGPWIARLDWVLVGGESGGKARPMDVRWLEGVVGDCKAAGVPVFVKQYGRRPMNDVLIPTSRLLLKSMKGNDPAEWPEQMRIREFPRVVPFNAAGVLQNVASA